MSEEEYELYFDEDLRRDDFLDAENEDGEWRENIMLLPPPEYTKPIYGDYPQNDCNKCQPVTFDTIEEQINQQQKFIEKELEEERC